MLSRKQLQVECSQCPGAESGQCRADKARGVCAFHTHEERVEQKLVLRNMWNQQRTKERGG